MGLSRSLEYCTRGELQQVPGKGHIQRQILKHWATDHAAVFDAFAVRTLDILPSPRSKVQLECQLIMLIVSYFFVMFLLWSLDTEEAVVCSVTNCHQNLIFPPCCRGWIADDTHSFCSYEPSTIQPRTKMQQQIIFVNTAWSSILQNVLVCSNLTHCHITEI